MRTFIRVLIIGCALAATSLVSGCIIVPAGGHRCGYYHCW